MWIWLLRLMKDGGLPDGTADSGLIIAGRVAWIFTGILVLRLGLWRLRERENDSLTFINDAGTVLVAVPAYLINVSMS